MENLIELRNIIRRPVLTEKATDLKEKYNQYVFKVPLSVNKLRIKEAVEKVFNVTVTDVHTIKVHGKRKKRPRQRVAGKRPDWKKAIVTLAKEDSISIYTSV